MKSRVDKVTLTYAFLVPPKAIIWTHVLKWYVVRCGFSNGDQTYVC
jgi:hypothetical protein